MAEPYQPSMTATDYATRVDAVQIIAPKAYMNEFGLQLLDGNDVESKLLGQAPFAIYFLAQVLLLSTPRRDVNFTVRDFELNVPTNGFQYLRYTRFRPAVTQIAHDGYHAFYRAHSNINQIRLISNQIPNTVERIIYILDVGTANDIRAYLPNELQRVMYFSTESARLAEDIVHRFEFVGNLTKELIRACEDTKGTHDIEYERVMQELKTAQEKERLLREKQQRYKAMVDESRDSVKQFESEYREALRSQPTAGDLFIAKIGDGIGAMLPIVTQSFLLRMGPPFGLVDMYSAPGVANGMEASKDAIFMSLLPPFVGGVARGMQMAGLHEDGGSVAAAMAQLPSWRLALKSMKHLLGKVASDEEASESVSEVEDILDMGLEIVDTLMQIARANGNSSTTINNSTLESIVNRFIELSEELEKDEYNAKKKPFIIPHRPMNKKQIRNAAETISQVESSAAALTNNYQKRLESSSAMLREKMNNYRQQVAAYESVMDQTMQVVLEIQSKTARKLDINDVIELLKKALVQLGQLVVAWDEVARFFRNLADIVKIPMGQALQELRETATIHRQARMNEEALANMAAEQNPMIKLLYESAFKCAAIGNYVSGIATAYVNVSNQYFLPELSSLNQLLGLDGVQNAQLMINKNNEVYTKLNLAKQGVIDMVRLHQVSMEAQTNRTYNYYQRKIAKVKQLSRTMDENKELRRRRR